MSVRNLKIPLGTQSLRIWRSVSKGRLEEIVFLTHGQQWTSFEFPFVIASPKEEPALRTVGVDNDHDFCKRELFHEILGRFGSSRCDCAVVVSIVVT